MIVGVKGLKTIFIEIMVEIQDQVRIILFQHLVDLKHLSQVDSKEVVKIKYQDQDNTILILKLDNLVLPSSIAWVEDLILQQGMKLQDQELIMQINKNQREVLNSLKDNAADLTTLQANMFQVQVLMDQLNVTLLKAMHQNTRNLIKHNRLGGKPTTGNNTSHSPGPGAYNLKGAIGYEGPKVAISGKPGTAGSATAYVPGPGSYAPIDMKSKAPSYKLGTAQRGREEKEARLVPGPGSYNLADNAIRGSTPGWG